MENISENKAERSAKIEQLRERFEADQGGVLTDYRGLNVAQMSELRRKFREVGASYRVVKNTLTRLAATRSSYEALSELLVGPTAIAFSQRDAIAAAKVAVEYAKDNETFEVKGGFFEGDVLSAELVAEISRLGDKDQLLAQLLSVFNAPSVRFLSVLNGVPQKFLGVLKARADQLPGDA